MVRQDSHIRGYIYDCRLGSKKILRQEKVNLMIDLKILKRFFAKLLWPKPLLSDLAHQIW